MGTGKPVEKMSPVTDDGKTPLIIESQDGFDAVVRELRRTIIRVSAVCLLILAVAGTLCGVILAMTSKPGTTINDTSTSPPNTSDQIVHPSLVQDKTRQEEENRQLLYLLGFGAGKNVLDCQWSAWSQWRPCSQSCQGGQQLRTRIVTRHQVGDGQPCEGGHEESRRCNTWPCPGLVDCSGGEKSLYEAAKKGNVTEVQGLIGCPGMDINYADSDGRTGLWRAAFDGHLQVVKLLLSTPGIDPNKATTGTTCTTCTAGTTPLFVASQEGHGTVVRELLSHPQIDPNQARTEDGVTPLFIASELGYDAIVRELLSHPQTDPNQAGTDEGQKGITPLYIASHEGLFYVVRELLSHPKTDPNQARPEDGATPLYIASENGVWTVVKELLTHPQTDPNQALTTDGVTPIWQASQNGHAIVVKELLSHPQTDPNQARTTDGATPLFSASALGHVDVVKELLADKRVNPNIRRTNLWKDTAIHMAAQKERVEVVKLLLKCPKVDITVRNIEGDNALENARKYGTFNAEIEQALQSRQTLLEQGHTC